MTKYNQTHTLGAPHYKAHFRFLRKLKDFKCALRSEKYGNQPICGFCQYIGIGRNDRFYRPR